MLQYFTSRVRPFCYCGILPFFERKEVHDEVEKPQKFIPKTGFERILALFHFDEKGYCSKEYTSTVQLTGASFLVGFMYGAFEKGKESHERFLAENQQTRFLSAYEARRKLNDFVLRKAMQNGAVRGFKFALVTAVYSTTIMLIVAYRDKDGILEFTTGGFIAGLCARTHLGWKAALAAGAVGGALGTFIGTTSFLCGKLAGISMSDVRQWQYELRANRDEQFIEIQKQSALRKTEEGLLLKQKIEQLKNNFLGYKVDDKDVKFVIVNPDDSVVDTVTDKPKSATSETDLLRNEKSVHSTGGSASSETMHLHHMSEMKEQPA